MTFNWWKRLALEASVLAFIPIFILAALLPARRSAYIWGTVPVICMSYWARAVRASGLNSYTLMSGTQAFDSRDKFDRYFEDFAPRFLPRQLRWLLGSNIALVHALRNAQVLHFSFLGFALGPSLFWRIEAYLFKLAKIKTVIIPFGADGYMVSELTDTTLRYALLAARPQFARIESATRRKTCYWMKHADIIVGSWMVEGLGRWDVTVHQPRVIDIDEWSPKTEYSGNDGTNGTVKIVHAPSHRRFKGTEFVIAAVEQLQAEGLLVELVLVEGIPNAEVGNFLKAGDVLVEQVLATAYAISALEGLASGLPVVCNLDYEANTRIFRRASFLDECPVVSSGPESLATTLRDLVVDPALRTCLGKASRKFCEKYHSYAMAQFMFGAIYDRVVHNRDVDLITLFHPLLSPYNQSLPKIEHPLKNSKISK